MYLIGYILNLGVDIYTGIIVLQVALSWLIAFEVINSGNEQAQNLTRLLARATDPVYKPLHKYVPPIGGIDITPLIVIIGLTILKNAIIIPLFY